MNRRDFVKWTTLMGAASAFPGWSRYALAESRPPLPIPALLEPDVRGSISLTLQRGQSQFLPGISTDTWGVNGNLLGPALRIRRGTPVSVTVNNRLDVASTVHWHGLEIAGDVDGGPQALIPPGQNRKVTLQLDQPAATCWFHPHPHQTSEIGRAHV